MTAQRFLFENSFDARRRPSRRDGSDGKGGSAGAFSDSDADCAPSDVPTQSFTEQELIEARAEALAEAAGGIERQCKELLEQIAGQLPSLQRAEEEAFLTANRECLALATATLKKLFPRFEPQGALQEIEAILEESLVQLRQEPRIVVRLHDDLLDPVKGRLDSLTHSQGFEGKVVLLADAEMGPSDVRIEFADGGIERCARQLWGEIETRLKEAQSRLEVAAAAPATPPSPPAQDES